MHAHAVRFGPNTDVVPALQAVVHQLLETASSCCILTAVGSLTSVHLRMASASRKTDDNEPPPEVLYQHLHERVEIVSLVGTFSADGGKHLLNSLA